MPVETSLIVLRLTKTNAKEVRQRIKKAGHDEAAAAVHDLARKPNHRTYLFSTPDKDPVCLLPCRFANQYAVMLPPVVMSNEPLIPAAYQQFLAILSSELEVMGITARGTLDDMGEQDLRDWREWIEAGMVKPSRKFDHAATSNTTVHGTRLSAFDAVIRFKVQVYENEEKGAIQYKQQEEDPAENES